MNARTRIAVAAAFTTVLALGATGCSLDGSKADQPFMDAPKGAINKQPMDIVVMSDGFSNVGAKCDGPNRVYVIFHGNDKYGSLAVAPNDPRCTTR
ncbi:MULTISPECIES: hypothetical protein [Streptomycetaceae]|uniref:hypothetical protein n=1 Tax=Streptomycetaceae TaxID=2062 RepID=UPI0004C1A09D|nr:hypothetical protein [Streptomyces sp. NRRL S-350]